MEKRNSTQLAQTSLTLVAIAASGWVLFVAQGTIIPIVFGALSAIVLKTMADNLGRAPFVGRHLPYSIRIILAFTVFMLLSVFVAALIARNLEQVIRVLPAYAETFSKMFGNLAQDFGYEIDLTWHSLQDTFADSIDLRQILVYSAGTFSGSVVYLFLVLVYALFFLAEARYLGAKLSLVFKGTGNADNARMVIDAITVKIGTYFTVKTIINIMLAIVCYAILQVYGIEFAVFWAILTGLFNYIPYIGSIVAVTLPIFVSVGQFESVATTISLALSLFVTQLLFGYLLEPRLLGKQLNLSPLMILISLASWGALWGIPGAVLSVPLAVTMMSIAAAFQFSRPVAIFLSETGDIENKPSRKK